MSYSLQITNDAIEDIEYLKKAGDKAILKKLATLLEELTDHPYTGTGQPEELKYNFSGCWSRRKATNTGLYILSKRNEKRL